MTSHKEGGQKKSYAAESVSLKEGLARVQDRQFRKFQKSKTNGKTRPGETGDYKTAWRTIEVGALRGVRSLSKHGHKKYGGEIRGGRRGGILQGGFMRYQSKRKRGECSGYQAYTLGLNGFRHRGKIVRGEREKHFRGHGDIVLGGWGVSPKREERILVIKIHPAKRAWEKRREVSLACTSRPSMSEKRRDRLRICGLGTGERNRGKGRRQQENKRGTFEYVGNQPVEGRGGESGAKGGGA